MLRALVATVGVLLIGSASTGIAAPCGGFTDVDDTNPATAPFCANVTWVKNRGVTLGCPSTGAPRYCPNDPVSRLQMAAFMNRLGEALFPSTCAAGEVMKWNGLEWGCSSDNIGGGGGGGTVTSVAAGTGLQGTPNPITGAGTLTLATGYRLPQACSNGQVAKSNGSGGWVCASDAGGAGTVTSITAGTGLTGGVITGSGTIAADTTYLQRRISATCAVGSSIRAIAADGTVTCEADDTGLANAFVQGGNAFNAVAKVGASDAFGVEILAGGKRAIRAEPNASSPRIISGFENNGAYAGVIGATIAGGGNTGAFYNGVPCPYAFGCQNSVTEHFGTIGGGLGNIVGEADGDLDNGAFGTVAGGVANSALFAGAVGGGDNNQAGIYGVVAGGGANVVSGSYSAIGGGVQNRASNMASFVAGGVANDATGNYSFAAGLSANANADGCVVFANGNPTGVDVTCGGANRFVALAAGGYFLYSNASGAGVTLAPGASAFAPASDRAMKTGIDRVDIAQVLDRVVALPISTWRWKDEVSQSLHMGPMAQDFHAAFGLGDDEKRIVTVDADGVALAAIQGLNAKFEAERAAKDAEIAELRAALADLRSFKEEVANLRAAQSSRRYEPR